MKNYSQANQDITALKIEDGKKGTYVEIGVLYPIKLSNTKLLEESGWVGLSIDIIDIPDWYKNRNNKLIKTDGIKCDYKELFQKNNLPNRISYLSLDIDEYSTEALKIIPFDEYSFDFITIEHDQYRFGNKYKDEQTNILEKLGYIKIVDNVGATEFFEDWWVHNSIFKKSKFIKIKNIQHDKLPNALFR